MSYQYLNDQKIYLEEDGTISVTTLNYENLVTSDNDVPNKKYVDNALTSLAVNAFIFKGPIALASDFPTLASVEIGWLYRLTADVTDSDLSKTHTGQSFFAGDDIAWNGTNWTEVGSESATSVSYNNAISGLTATNVQAALDELDATIGALSSAHNSLTGLQGGTTSQYYHLTATQHSDLTNQSTNLKTTGTPTFANVTDSGLTANRLLSSNGTKVLSSVSDLTAWIGGTANRVTVSNDGDGSITLSAPQDLHTAATPTFAGLTDTSLTASRLMASNGSKKHTSVASLTNYIAGTTGQITVTDDGDGTVTLSIPSTPIFAGINLSSQVIGGPTYAVLPTDYTLLGDTTSGAITIDLPSVAGEQGRILVIKKIDGSPNTITIDGFAAETIDGAITKVLNTQWQSIILQAENAIPGWYILAIK